VDLPVEGRWACPGVQVDLVVPLALVDTEVLLAGLVPVAQVPAVRVNPVVQAALVALKVRWVQVPPAIRVAPKVRGGSGGPEGPGGEGTDNCITHLLVAGENSRAWITCEPSPPASGGDTSGSGSGSGGDAQPGSGGERPNPDDPHGQTGSMPNPDGSGPVSPRSHDWYPNPEGTGGSGPRSRVDMPNPEGSDGGTPRSLGAGWRLVYTGQLQAHLAESTAVTITIAPAGQAAR
jgi:hypothetical protein